MAIVRNAPEAESLKGPRLGVLGRLSYSIYLLHVPVLGLMHGLVLGGRPDIGTPAQLLVTCAAVPVALGLAWVVNRLVEQPMIEYGRRWRFSAREHQPSPSLASG
jgi:peptidoglycan/LPS O-acetylase OafA/YrhL